jgi:peptidoglycan hydrolase CwlO-like protein
VLRGEAMGNLIPTKNVFALLAAAVAVVLGLAFGLPGPSAADVQNNIASKQAAADALKSQIASDSHEISQTSSGLASARERLGTLEAAVTARESQLANVERSLIAARDHLTGLENRLEGASKALAANLLATYESNTPDAVTVVLESHGFSDLLDRLDFLRDAGKHDASVVQLTQQARQEVVHQAVMLDSLEGRDRVLAQSVVVQRNQASALQGALLSAQIAEVRHRATDAADLSKVQGQLNTLEAQEVAVVATAAAPAPSPSGIAVDTGGMVQAPAGAPAAVADVIAAGNAIATLPYLYGGGHASFQADAYDCSGSVSYALAAAGLVTSPLDSTDFESWGEPGPGQWITVYANAGHAFMVVGGWRFDTVALAEGGTRWSSTMTSTAGFVARHPAGL